LFQNLGIFSKFQAWDYSIQPWNFFSVSEGEFKSVELHDLPPIGRSTAFKRANAC